MLPKRPLFEATGGAFFVCPLYRHYPVVCTMNTPVTDISIDPTACTGCESCAELCPACFAMHAETGLAIVIDPHPEAIPDCLHEAVSCCPTQCIAVEYTGPGAI